jgi:hypothetical protein
MNPNDQNLDAFQVFGTRRPYTNAEELYHRELQRKSFDIIRVKNPDNTDFYFDWDKRYYHVPANGTADIMRYLAITYCRNKAIDTINKTAEKMHKAEIEDRQRKGLPAYQSKYDENKETYASARYPKTNDRELLAKLYSEYWVGLVSEYGKDMPPDMRQEPEQGFDLTPIELKIIKELEGRRVDFVETPVKEEPVFTKKFEGEPVPTPKEELVEEITVKTTNEIQKDN